MLSFGYSNFTLIAKKRKCLLSYFSEPHLTFYQSRVMMVCYFNPPCAVAALSPVFWQILLTVTAAHKSSNDTGDKVFGGNVPPPLFLGCQVSFCSGEDVER